MEGDGDGGVRITLLSRQRVVPGHRGGGLRMRGDLAAGGRGA